jgi:ribonuclease R
VCSLQEGVPRLCKSAFITFDDDARPIRTRFANTVINSAKRLRYREAQAIIEKSQTIPHPEGPRRLVDYPPEVVELLDEMNTLAKRIQRRRLEEGQIVLELPEVELVLDEEGKVAGTAQEEPASPADQMFMVEANGRWRLFDSMNLPFMQQFIPSGSRTAQHGAAFRAGGRFKLPKDEPQGDSVSSLQRAGKARVVCDQPGGAQEPGAR